MSINISPPQRGHSFNFHLDIFICPPFTSLHPFKKRATILCYADIVEAKSGKVIKFWLDKLHFDYILSVWQNQVFFGHKGRCHESLRVKGEFVRLIARGPLAQLVEQQTFNLWVPGSIPGRLISF
jgi:hypothetical protein